MPKYETKQRKALLSLLCDNADKPISAADMVKSIQGISLSAVYRNLTVLQYEGKVQRISVAGSKKVYYRYTGAKECEKHLHLSCSKCGKTFHMNVLDTHSLIDNVLTGSNFKVDSANTVLYGVCGNCEKQRKI